MSKAGFTMFFAVLVSSLALAIGVAIYDLVIRQLSLSQTTALSQYAIYAADTGVECALYWDSKYNGTKSAFATSTASSPPGSGVVCNGYDVAQSGTAPTPFSAQPTGWTPWVIAETPTAATTTFSINFPIASGGYRCATIIVAKYLDQSVTPNVPHSTIVSHGYSTCDVSSPSRVERVLQATF